MVELLLRLIQRNLHLGEQSLDFDHFILIPKSQLRHSEVGVEDALFQGPMAEKHELELLFDHYCTYILIMCFTGHQLEEVFIFVI